MQNLLSDLLHVDVVECEYSGQEKLPLFLQSNYQIKRGYYCRYESLIRQTQGTSYVFCP